MEGYPQSNIGRTRMAQARRLAMRDRATTLAAKWADGQREHVRSVLTKPAPKVGTLALAVLISRSLHDNGEDWRGFVDWLVGVAIAE